MPKAENYYALINAGGSGTRFWPLSTAETPKQFTSLVTDNSLLQDTISRVKKLIPIERIFIVCLKNHKEKVRAQLPALPEENIIAEPEGRNTAPAICLSTLWIYSKNKKAIIASLHSDHVIPDEEIYLDSLQEAYLSAERENAVVTIGLKPSRIETGYGYIKIGDKIEASQKVEVHIGEGFYEKPTFDVAKEYVESGQYMWNGGMFIYRASYMLDLFRKFLPEVINPLEALFARDKGGELAEVYELLPEVSIDCGIMEKTKNILVVPTYCRWTDIGIWSSMAEILDKDDKGNMAKGKNILIDSEDNIIFSSHTPIACIGVKNLIVVSTENGVLVCDRDRAQDVRKISELLKNK